MSEPASLPGLPTLAKYELLEEIGHGGMATVYRARDPRLGREVAVKVIHKHLRENAEVATRFVAEARAAAKLRHPGIVEVYDVSNEDDDERFLVVELLRGATLRKVLVGHREMPAEVGAAITLELCDALDHAHESGIIHRDIKPENVLVELPGDRLAVSSKRGTQANRTPVPAERNSEGPPTDPDPEPLAPAESDAVAIGETQRSLRDAVAPIQTHREKKARKDATKAERSDSGRKARPADMGVTIKITDFGIAKVLDAQGVTSTGQVLGSPAHMAPEQIEGGDVDARTDVFALGVLLYECLVGHLPFEGKNPAQVLRKVLDGTFSAADRERASVGARWAKVVAAALTRDAAGRTPSPAAMAESIRAELTALGIDHPRAEIAAFFADPAGYTTGHHARLVPRLLTRGEAAHRAGDVWGASADFNRALALKPNDFAILKRVTGMTSSASRRQLARRVATIAAGSVLLGFAAFGIARLVKAAMASVESSKPAPDPVETAELDPFEVNFDDLPPPTRPSRTQIPLPSVFSASPTADAPVQTRPVGPPVGPNAGKRQVRFVLNPSGASLAIDGTDVAWQRATLWLTTGEHHAKLTINSNCCKAPDDRKFIVETAPADKPDDVKHVSFNLEVLAARIMLAGAPPSGTMKCPALGVVLAPGEVKTITPARALTEDSCVFESSLGKQRGTVSINAGVDNRIRWP